MLLEACARGEYDLRKESAGNRQEPLRMLLHFVTLLEMSVYAASEGSLSIPLASPASVKFFRSNKKVVLLLSCMQA